MNDNLIIVIAAVLFFFWYRMQQAMAAALCQGGGISSGCGPSGLILGGQKIVVPGFGTAPACRGRGTSSIFCCSPVRQGPIKSPVIGPVRVIPPVGSRFPIDVVPMGMASQTTTLPKPMGTMAKPPVQSSGPCLGASAGSIGGGLASIGIVGTLLNLLNKMKVPIQKCCVTVGIPIVPNAPPVTSGGTNTANAASINSFFAGSQAGGYGSGAGPRHSSVL